jgi:hypothetical protein
VDSWTLQEAELRESARQAKLRVLIWGPGDPGPSAAPEAKQRYEKRLKMRKAVESTFPRAEVRFSEDPPLLALTATIPGLLRKEAVHAKLAHVVLMLDISRGADLELDHFVPTYPWFRDKVYVFLPEAYVGTTGLVSDVFKYLRPDQLLGYTAAEYGACSVATIKAIEIVDAVAISHLLTS